VALSGLVGCGGGTVNTHAETPQELMGLDVVIGPGVELSGEGVPANAGFGDALVGAMQSRLVGDGFDVVPPGRGASAVRVQTRAQITVSKNSFIQVNGKPLESTSARVQVTLFAPDGAMLDAFDVSGSPDDDTAREVAAQLGERMKGSRRLIALAKSAPSTAPRAEASPASATLAQNDAAPAKAAAVPVAATLGAGNAGRAMANTARWPDVARKLSGQQDGQRDVAVIVAIEDYNTLARIPGARSNAEDWFKYLTETRGLERSNIQMLQDEGARYEQIEKAVLETVPRAKQGGRFWFVFIGHGAPSRKQTGLLVGWDAYQTAEGLEDRSVKTERLLQDMSASRATPVVFLDACFSGRESSGQSLVAGLMPSAVVKAKAPSGALVLTAARSDQFAGGLPGAARPAFSYLALGALRGWADSDGNGKVSAVEVEHYVGDTLRILLAGKRQQVPTLDGDRKELELSTATEREPAAVRSMFAAQGQP